jgi:hypothetical protein
MKISRRTWFFLGVAATCAILIPLTPDAFRPLNVGMAILATFWAVLLAIESATRGGGGRA